MFNITNNYTYSSEDWNLMQRAHNAVSALLQRCPKEHENAARLARTVMKLFDQGLRDDALIAKAAEQELMVSGIAEHRDTRIAS